MLYPVKYMGKDTTNMIRWNTNEEKKVCKTEVKLRKKCRKVVKIYKAIAIRIEVVETHIDYQRLKDWWIKPE